LLQAQRERLQKIIDHGREISAQLPDVLICFPTDIIDDRSHFGVVMPTATGKEMAHDCWFLPPDNQTPEFTGKAIYAVHQNAFPYQNLILGAFCVARAIDLLHRKGMAHSDLSLGNVFIDPSKGIVSIIDCDNLACDGYLAHQVHGTPGFIAPELLCNKGNAVVSTRTDRFSLAVILYYLLVLRHPFIGNQGNNWNPAHKAPEDSYGIRAIFTEHPTIASNRFKGNLPHIAFGSLPEAIRNMFVEVFVHGLKSPDKRPTSRLWAQELWRAFEDTLECERCRQRFFVSPNKAKCSFCHHTSKGPHYTLRSTNGRMLFAEHGRKVYPHHSSISKEFDFSNELCEFQMRPMGNGASQMILRNLNARNLEVVIGGAARRCEPGKGFVLKGVGNVTIGDISYVVESL
jgi:serine/threonine protein kinase